MLNSLTTIARLRAARHVASTLFLVAIGSSLTFAQGKLTFDPVNGPVGTMVTATASGLEPGADVALVWETADADWQVDPDGRFLGVDASARTMVLEHAVVDEQGDATIAFDVPEDYGYVHNVYVVSDGANVAHQGFTVVPKLTVTPLSGPVGTPITIRVTGIGFRFWEMTLHLLYDGAYTGLLSAISTGGTATTVIPASGAIGLHTLQILGGTTSVPYMNKQQSPNFNPNIPAILGTVFEVTRGQAILPPDPAEQSLPRDTPGEATPTAGATVSLGFSSGAVGSPIEVRGNGFPAGEAVALAWTTTRGNDIISGLVEATLDLGNVTAASDGTFQSSVVTPDDLGGPHTIRATNGDVEAEASYTITPSVSSVMPKVVAPGDLITVTVKGVGWTDTANIYTFVMDNGFLGYGCGVNSSGDVTVNLMAPGQIGMHFIDIYPSVYRGVATGPGAPPPPRLKPGEDASLLPGANVTYLQQPMLNWQDHPGEDLPAFHLAFEVR